MADIMIVPVNADNAADFGSVIYHSWCETYRGLMPDEILDGRSADRWTNRARQSPDNKLLVYVGDEAAGAVGMLPQARDFCTHKDSFEIVTPDTAAYQEAGNSIVVDVLIAILKQLDITKYGIE